MEITATNTIIGQYNLIDYTCNLIEMLPESYEVKIHRMITHGHVFVSKRGIGISSGYEMLYPNGIIYNGACDGVWCYNSEHEALMYLESFKKMYNKLN